jgi:hypothetical protein
VSVVCFSYRTVEFWSFDQIETNRNKSKQITHKIGQKLVLCCLIFSVCVTAACAASDVSVQQQHVLLLLDEPVLHALSFAAPTRTCSSEVCAVILEVYVLQHLWKPVLPPGPVSSAGDSAACTVLYVLQQTVLSSHASSAAPVRVWVLQQRVLSLNVPVLQQPVLPLDMSVLKKSVLPLDMSVLQ